MKKLSVLFSILALAILFTASAFADGVLNPPSSTTTVTGGTSVQTIIQAFTVAPDNGFTDAIGGGVSYTAADFSATSEKGKDLSGYASTTGNSSVVAGALSLTNWNYNTSFDTSSAVGNTNTEAYAGVSGPQCITSTTSTSTGGQLTIGTLAVSATNPTTYAYTNIGASYEGANSNNGVSSYSTGSLNSVSNSMAISTPGFSASTTTGTSTVNVYSGGTTSTNHKD